MTKITVYITNYNYEKYIRRAIESVINQTYKNFEVIIIDDGSSDGSKSIIEEYSSLSNFKLIFQKNKGLNITNNIALRVADGEYIMRLDADDFLDPNALLVMSNILDKDKSLGLVFPDYYIVDANDNIINIEKRHSFEKDVSLLDQPAHGACTMIRKKFLQQLGGYDEQFSCQDGYDLWIKFITKYKVTNVNTPLFYYRQHGSNLTTNEERILNTRAKIKEKFVRKQNIDTLKTLAIIPVRGSKYSNKNLAFSKLKDKYLIDIKINEAIEAKNISKVIVSTPDIEIENHILSKYIINQKVLFHKRTEEFARLNSDLTSTINEILGLDEINKGGYQAIVILPIEHPFIDNTIIDDAINTLQIFNADSLITVRQETNMFFKHDGSGMKPIFNMEGFSKLERDALYKHTGGLIAVRVNNFISEQKLIAGTVGHIVIDQKAAMSIKSKLDFEIACWIYEKIDLSLKK